MKAVLNPDRLIIREGQLRNWMDTRNRHLALLIKRSVAGGRVPIEVGFDEGREG